MREGLQILYDYLLINYPKEKVEKLIKGISNPARYSWIVEEIKDCLKKLKKNTNLLKKKDILKIHQIMEDELVNALLIYQDSKCDPFKFINFKVN